MNDIELNAVLYWADYLSLKHSNHPVTNSCKYFYVHGVPMLSDYILNLPMLYNDQNKYFNQAKAHYNLLKNKFGESGVQSFIEDTCSIKAAGMVDGDRMMQDIHQFSTRHDRNVAFKSYKKWKENKKYHHTTINDDGDPVEKECSKYVFHAELDGQQ